MRNQSIADDSSIDHRMTKLEGLVEQLNLRMWSLQGGHKEMSKRMDDMGVRLDWVETVEKTTTVAKKTNGQETGNALVQPLDWVDIVEKAMTEAQAKVCEVSPNFPSEDIQLQSHDLESKLDSDCHNLVEIVEKAMTKAQAKVCEVSPNLPSEDIQLQSHDLESKLDSDCHNLPDIKSITQTFDSRMESLEKRLFDLADNQLRQQRAGEVQHTEMRLLFTQLQADTTKQQCEQVQQVQQLEEALGVLKSIPDKCLSKSASHLKDVPCVENDHQDLSKSIPGTARSHRATHQVSSTLASVTSTRASPRQSRSGSKSVQLPPPDFAESAKSATLLASGSQPNIGLSPRVRSVSPRPSSTPRQPQQAISHQQSLLSENKVGVSPRIRHSPTATRVPATRHPLSARSAAPGSQRVHISQQGFKAEKVASPVVPHMTAPKFISGRSTAPATSALLTRKQQINIGGA